MLPPECDLASDPELSGLSRDAVCLLGFEAGRNSDLADRYQTSGRITCERFHHSVGCA